jgi:hypothetical protein
MQKRLVALLLASLALASYAQDKGKVESFEVPFEFKANIILVKGSINGNDGHIFVFDTGAEKNIITPTAAQQCGVQMGGGGLGTPELGVGGAKAQNCESAIMDPPQLHPLRQYGVNYSGVIGYPFIANFVTRFDYKNQKLLFTPASKAPKSEKPAKGWICDFKFVRSLCLLENIKVNGKGPYTFLLDSGASETVVMPDTARELGLKGQMVPSQTVGQVEQVKLDSMACGDAEVKGMEICVYDPPQARPLKAANGGKLDGLLGRSFFDKFLLTVDYRTKQIVLEPIDGGGSTPPKKQTPKKKGK